MTLRQWAGLIGVVVLLGAGKVAQQTMMWFHAYELGKQVSTAHELENDTRLLQAKVDALQSPTQLVNVLGDKRLTLVAWSELDAKPTRVKLASVTQVSRADQHTDR